MITRQPILELVFDGPAIYEGRILPVDLFDFVSNFQSAIQKTITVLTTGQSARLGRPPKVLQELSALEIAGITQGSFGITLDFRREAAHLPLFDLGETAIEKLISGLSVIGNDTQLPEGFDRGVLIALREAGRILDRGINTVHINSPRYAHNMRAAYAAQTRERIVAQIRKFEQAWAVVEGRLLMADVKEDVLRCRIHPSTGEPIIGIFD